VDDKPRFKVVRCVYCTGAESHGFLHRCPICLGTGVHLEVVNNRQGKASEILREMLDVFRAYRKREADDA